MGKKNPSEITKWLSGTHNFTVETLVELESFFLELTKRLGTKVETITDNADMRLFQAMERNRKTP